MVEASEKKYKVILDYEMSFARAVAMGVHMRRPFTIWRLLIPFVFVFDNLRMRSDAEVFAKNFVYIKKMALDAALDISKGEKRQSKLAQIENETREWPISKKLFSSQIHQGQMTEIDLLIEHYARLLGAEGDDYQSLVQGAYQTPEQFNAFLQQLSSIEKEIDTAVIAVMDPGKREEAWESMLAKQTLIDETRTSSIGKFFPGTRRE